MITYYECDDVENALRELNLKQSHESNDERDHAYWHLHYRSQC